MEYKRRSEAHCAKLETLPPLNETADEKKTRLLDEAAEECHLEALLRKTDTLQSLETQLEAYRLESWGKSRAMMRQEFECEKLSPAGKNLGQNLLANIEPRPSEKYDAHHIIPGAGTHSSMGRLRAKLFSNGIKINDPLNGIWLAHLKIDRGHHLSPESHIHPDTYGWNYQQWLSTRLRNLKDRPPNRAIPPWIKSNYSPFIKELASIKQRLNDGKCPVEIMEPKDDTWRGN
ncbi:MAG: hypothetical protein ACI93R_000981 [Flavobacteriales bacterium]|jgi:hypothetical protein